MNYEIGINEKQSCNMLRRLFFYRDIEQSYSMHATCNFRTKNKSTQIRPSGFSNVVEDGFPCWFFHFSHVRLVDITRGI